MVQAVAQGTQMVPTISIDDLSNGVAALKVETPDPGNDLNLYYGSFNVDYII